jgi:hypothetical protein
MIYGVDLGMRSLYIYGDDGPRVITVPKSDRYTEIWRMSEEIFEAFHVEDLIFYEEPVLAGPKNIRTVIGLAPGTRWRYLFGMWWRSEFHGCSMYS